MKKFYLLIALFCISFAYANNDKYRLIVNSDPSTTVTIAFNQIDGVSPMLHYGTTDFGTAFASYPNTKAVDRAVTRKGMDNHFIRLTGLLPNTAYYFVINDSNSTSIRLWFKTAPNDLSRLSFIAGGDSRNNRTPRQAANSLVSKLKPHAVLFGGDMTNSNTDAEWSDWFDDWQLTTAGDGRMFPIVATRGNHENETTVIYDLFDTPTSNSYYGVTFGDDLFRIITLNTELAPSGAQKTWLENDLAAHSDVQWKSAQYHKPMRPHTSAKAEGIDRYNAWAQLFFDEGVKLVFESDSHTVKNTWPVEPSSGTGSSEGFIRNDNDGTVYAGEGCWGAPTRVADDNKPWTRDSGKFNQFKLVFVDQDKIELRTIKVDNAASVGEVSNTDSFTLPANLDVWNPSNGDVVLITNLRKSRISFAEDTPIHFDSSTNETVQITIDDEGDGITQVEYYIDNVLVGTDDTAPYTFTHMFPVGSHQLQARATSVNGLIANATLNFYSGSFSESNTTIFISDGDHDAEQWQDGTVHFTSSDLELIYDSGTSGALQTIGLRFENLNIPVGATISNARIQFTSDHDSANDTVSLTIDAENTSNPGPLVNEVNNISGRNRVSGTVPWSPSQWNNNDRGSNQLTPNLNGLLQQVIDRCDWEAGNDAVFIIEGSGTNFRRVDSYDHNPALAAALVFSYTFDATLLSNTIDVEIDDTIATDYTSPTSVTVDALVNENGLGISAVEFFVDGVLVKTDTSVPYNYTQVYGVGTHLIEAKVSDGCIDDSSNISINVGSFTHNGITAINSDEDDVEETQAGRVYFDSSDLEMINDDGNSIFDGVPNADQKIGLRFNKIQIPFGATLTNAYIEFAPDENNTVDTFLRITSEDIGNALPFVDSQKMRPSGRAKVPSNVDWDITNSWSTANSATRYNSPNIMSLIQPIVDRCDWEQGNSLTLMIEGRGASLTDPNAKRVADTHDASPSRAPKLYYTYTYNANPAGTDKVIYTAGAWNNGSGPTSDSHVVIRSNYDTSVLGNIDGCFLEIEKGAELTVTAGNVIDVYGTIKVEGTLTIQHQGIVVQTDPDAKVDNQGEIKVELTTPFLQSRDFMVMGSPMTSESRNGVYHDAFIVMQPTSENFIPHPGVPPGGTNFADDDTVNGKFLSMYHAGVEAGNGYLVRPQSGWLHGDDTFYMTYVQGTLNNGDITKDIVYNGAGPNPNGTPNILGNPYASPISADMLIGNNALINEVYFWEHILPPSQSIPGSLAMNFSMDNISMYNMSMAIPAGGSNPVVSTTPNGIISTGQGFGIKATASGSVTFTNGMRLLSGNTTLRDQETELIDVNKLLVKVAHEDFGLQSTTGIAFRETATYNLDAGYDSDRLATSIALYSHLQNGDEQLGIQTLPDFEDTMQIPMGFATQVDDRVSYTISLDTSEGDALEQVDVILFDHIEQLYTTLSQTNYSFNSDMGTFNERFTLQFRSKVVLGTNDNNLNDVSVYPNPTSDILNITAGSEEISSITVIDMLGREVQQMTVQNNRAELDVSTFPSAIYFVKITTNQGTITKKIIKKD